MRRKELEGATVIEIIRKHNGGSSAHRGNIELDIRNCSNALHTQFEQKGLTRCDVSVVLIFCVQKKSVIERTGEQRKRLATAPMTNLGRNSLAVPQLNL